VGWDMDEIYIHLRISPSGRDAGFAFLTLQAGSRENIVFPAPCARDFTAGGI